MFWSVQTEENSLKTSSRKLLGQKINSVTMILSLTLTYREKKNKWITKIALKVAQS